MSARPRLGFLGVGWIGRHRMAAMLDSGAAEAIAVSDPSEEAVSEALTLAPGARPVGSLEEMLALSPDGVVIATPSALHAVQSIAALDSGAAVFCQKPLGRNAQEAAAVVEAARRADRLLGVDLSYRRTAAAEAILPLIHGRELGRIYAVELIFHNAYGPDKPWFWDREQAGGGCLVDLGVHLLDLAMLALDWPEIRVTGADLFARGERLRQPDAVEDFAAATLETGDGALIRLACSWRLQAGVEADIRAGFYGTRGGAMLRNVGGSFYDFVAERFSGTSAEQLVAPPDEWGGRMGRDWARQLAGSRGFDPEVGHVVEVARALDGIYAQAGLGEAGRG